MTKSGLWRTLLLLLAGTVVATGLSAPLTARAEDHAKVLLLLDVSGSMNEKISSGGTKFAAAKRALKQVADALQNRLAHGLLLRAVMDSLVRILEHVLGFRP